MHINEAIESGETLPLTDKNLVLTTQQVASILKVSPRSVQKLVKEQNLPAIHIGRKIRIPSTKFLRWLEEQVA